MATYGTKFDAFLKEEVSRVQGVYIPVKASFLRRLLICHTAIKALHPNPGDEFCDPRIGPNDRIISGYEEQLLEKRQRGQKTYFDEKVIVEKTRPDGYMLLNGHHRWAAALRMNVKRMRIKIVNLTNEDDIRKMIASSQNSRRVTLDLDEVVFLSGDDAPAEKPLSFLSRRLFPERLHLGVTALFRFLNTHHCDVWVYTAKYYSLEYIRHLFQAYHVQVTGIVTGAARKGGATADREKLENLIRDAYTDTLHIDRNAVLYVSKTDKQFREFPLSGSGNTWSKEIMDIISGL